MERPKIAKRLGLLPAEYFYKTAGVVGAIGAVFGEDEGTGYEYTSRITNGIKAFQKAPEWLYDNAETARGFAYSENLFEVSNYFSGVAKLFQSFATAYDNMANNWLMTSLAAGTIFALGFGMGEVVRYYRTEGRGSFWREFMRKKGQEKYGWKG
ncbi:MAG: hypothetical protein HYU56_04290 [Candidatus Aenigmarchaeota archaeon]|nr:hypothetical protein [Candidatus Aenigmarchaeota archaeon]